MTRRSDNSDGVADKSTLQAESMLFAATRTGRNGGQDGEGRGKTIADRGIIASPTAIHVFPPTGEAVAKMTKFAVSLLVG